VGARSARRRKRGVAMFVLGTKELKRYGFAAGASPSTNVPDPGFVPIARNARFSAYAACSRAASPAPRRIATMHRSSVGRPSAWHGGRAQPGEDVAGGAPCRPISVWRAPARRGRGDRPARRAGSGRPSV
jgi:hypothetical protein